MGGLSESDFERYGIAILLVVMQQQPNPTCVFFRPDTGDSPLQLVFGHLSSAEHVKAVTSVCMLHASIRRHLQLELTDDYAADPNSR